MDVESGGQLGFQFLQFCGQFLRAGEEFAHADEGPHYEDAHADGSGAIEDICRHDGPIFSEYVRKEATSAPSFV